MFDWSHVYQQSSLFQSIWVQETPFYWNSTAWNCWWHTYGSQQNSATVVILLDMNAAFDTVGLQKLIKILELKIGLKGTALTGLNHF